MRSDLEPRLIRIEQLTTVAIKALDAIQLEAGRVGQLIWETMPGTFSGGAMSIPAGPPDPSGCHSQTSANLPFTDSVWGSGTLVWDGTSIWTACLSGLSYAANANCGAATIAVHYQLDMSLGLTMKWITNTVPGCPTNSTCSTTPTGTHPLRSITLTPVNSSCAATPPYVQWSMPNSSPYNLLFAGNNGETITVYFPPPP